MEQNWFCYKNKQFLNYRDIIEYAFSLSESEQEIFVNIFANSSPFALQNIGYIAGYYDLETKHKIFKVFKTSHPIFGTLDPTPEQALETGKKWAESANKKKDSK